MRRNVCCMRIPSILRKKRATPVILLFLVASILTGLLFEMPDAGVTGSADTLQHSQESTATTSATVSRVIDGDTFVVDIHGALIHQK
jgi:endonuclease YncB( thermonuclease family)